jgi:hypothetical protein
MSAHPNPEAGNRPRDTAAGEFEVVDAVPVDGQGLPPVAPAPANGLQRRYGVAAPAVQAAAAAAGGFVAGAAVFGLVRRRQRRAGAPVRRQRGQRAGRRAESARPAVDLVQIVASRSLLVDVHLLAGPGGER